MNASKSRTSSPEPFDGLVRAVSLVFELARVYERFTPHQDADCQFFRPAAVGRLNHAAWLAAKAWPAVVARGNLAMLAFNEESWLPDIEIPVLVLGGQHDRMTKPIASQRMEELLPPSAPASVASGHLGLWSNHEKVAELIGEFTGRFAEKNQTTPMPDAKLAMKAT